MEKRFFETTRTARYYLLGNTQKPTTIWIALHGYGQQAKYFSKKAEALIDSQSLVIVPEAPYRFYLNGFEGRVGANWMTSDDRLIDIKDNALYLDGLVAQLLHQYQSINHVSIFAFSQGIATALRWYVQSKIKADKLILWAGSLPHDIDYTLYKAKLNESKINYVFGNKDEFFGQPKIMSNESLFLNSNIDYQKVVFFGNHEIDIELLKKLANE